MDSHYYLHAPADIGLINDIVKAINGEYSAIACYEVLSKLAPTEEIRKQILEIRNDEIRHYQVFTHMYMMLTGRQPTPTMIEQCASEYIAGVNAAFKDEQETVDFYNGVSARAHDPIIREEFARAAADEQNHAVWFLYFLIKR
jgi:rubrerythrin